MNMFDSESTLKDCAADLGIDLSGGALTHKREFARVVTCWKTDGRDEAADGRGCTSARSASHILARGLDGHDDGVPDRTPPQSCFENFAERP